MAGTADDLILEITVLGATQRVSAIDPASLVEVVFQAPLSADHVAIARLARQKLAFRLAKDRMAARPPGRTGGTVV